MNVLGGASGGSGLDGKPFEVCLRLKGVEGEFTIMTQEQVNALDTSFLRESIRLYNRWKLLHTLPHGGGTNDERESVLEILETLEGESNGFESWLLDHDSELVKDTAGGG